MSGAAVMALASGPTGFGFFLGWTVGLRRGFVLGWKSHAAPSEEQP